MLERFTSHFDLRFFTLLTEHSFNQKNRVTWIFCLILAGASSTIGQAHGTGSNSTPKTTEIIAKSISQLPTLNTEQAEILRESRLFYSQRNFIKARDLLLPLAAQGNSDAMIGIAQLIDEGHIEPILPKSLDPVMKSSPHTRMSASFSWYKNAADIGKQPVAQFEVGRRYALGHGVTLNGPQSVLYLTKAAKAGLPMASFELGRMTYLGQAIKKDKAKAITHIKQAAARGFPPALYFLAQAHIFGNNVEQNDKTALSLLHEAAAAGHPAASIDLAMAYRSGLGMDQPDPEKTLALLRILARETDNNDAAYELGRSYQFGYGVEIDMAKAALWYLKAANGEQVLAQYNLANLYREGKGVEPDPAAARIWYERAAKQGMVPAQINLAGLYLKGLGGPANLAQAQHWLLTAAKAGHPLAQYQLALTYQKDSKKNQTDIKAQTHYWLKQSAWQGFPPAQQELGISFLHDRATAKPEKAYYWLLLATQKGKFPKTPYLIAAREQMTELEQARVEKEVSLWKPGRPPIDKNTKNEINLGANDTPSSESMPDDPMTQFLKLELDLGTSHPESSPDP